MTLLLNIVFGLVPTFTLAWSIAADERKPTEDRVVGHPADRRQQNVMFSLIYGLWALTLSMWNWMRGAPLFWILLWIVFGVLALILTGILRRRATQA